MVGSLGFGLVYSRYDWKSGHKGQHFRIPCIAGLLKGVSPRPGEAQQISAGVARQPPGGVAKYDPIMDRGRKILTRLTVHIFLTIAAVRYGRSSISQFNTGRKMPEKSPRSFGPRRWGVTLPAVIALAGVVTAVPAFAKAADIDLPASAFSRAEFPSAEAASRILRSGDLAGERGGCCLAGSVHYDVSISEAGWYELTVAGRPLEVEFLIAPSAPATGSPSFQVYGGADAMLNGEDKVANLWLDAAAYTITLRREYWTGYPSITGIRLRKAGHDPAKMAFAAFGSPRPVFRSGQCPPLRVLAGGPAVRTWTLFAYVHASDGRQLTRTVLKIPASGGPQAHDLPVPCEKAGGYYVSFGTDASSIATRDMRPVLYEVIDTGASNPAARSSTRTLVQTIDLAARAPDYSSGGDTRIETTMLGAYRESGEFGFTSYQRAPQAARRGLPEPSWFAYKLTGLVPQKPHLVEVDYPDDARRSFAIALREAKPLSYPVSAGVDSGGEFSLSRAIKTHSLLFWPRSDQVRLAIMNIHDGMRAAASAIRVFRLDESPLPEYRRSAGRKFINWYEEGANFTSMFGMRDEWWKGEVQTETVERWVRSAAAAGYTMLMPTMVVYDFALYPSRFNRVFSKPDTDYLRRILLVAEKYGIRIVPELHPRADELDWPFASVPDPKPNLLLSRAGSTNFFRPDGRSRNYPPLFNPLHPSNQDWYVSMIGELVDRYKDSPALEGVSVRLMDWANPALNNFNSLEWGYDDSTIQLFLRETGTALPSSLLPGARPATSGQASRRYDWLMSNARSSWIDWRCRKIAQLYVRIRDRVREARPDLKVYSTVFPFGNDIDYRRSLIEAGIDPALLSRIEGVVLINALTSYGRREPDRILTQKIRDRLLQPSGLRALASGVEPGAFLSGAYYIEATDAIAPPQQLGFPAGTRATWMSIAVTPAGRHFLERYAIQLAETDAQVLGDGGNAYSLGQPLLGDWIREYRALPAVPFLRREDAVDPVAVWTREDAGGLTFYIVNHERYTVPLHLSILGTRQVTRIATGERLSLTQGKMTVKLAPYQLLAYSASPGSSIVEVSQSPPAVEVQRVQEQVAWIAELDKSVRSSPGTLGLDHDLEAVLSSTVDQAQAALTRHHYWRARVLLEDHRMMRIYSQVGEQPPDLRDAVLPE
jgi:hypothetical protein